MELLLAAGFDAVHVWLRPMRQTAPQTPQSSGRRGGRRAQVRLKLTNLIFDVRTELQETSGNASSASRSHGTWRPAWPARMYV